MVGLENLKERIESIIIECEEIIKNLDLELDSTDKASFQQVKEIERTIINLKKQGLAVPDELKHLKLKLLSDIDNFENINSLKKYFTENIQRILPNDISGRRKKLKSRQESYNAVGRKEPNYERPLGSKGNTRSKGNTLLEDYLIPVIKLMHEGWDYKNAFHKVKDELDVRYNTVSSQCTRGLGISTDEFVSQVKSGGIIKLLESKFHDKYNLIKNELVKN